MDNRMFTCVAFPVQGEAPEFACEGTEEEAIHQCAALFSSNPRFPARPASATLIDNEDNHPVDVTKRFNTQLDSFEREAAWAAE